MSVSNPQSQPDNTIDGEDLGASATSDKAKRPSVSKSLTYSMTYRFDELQWILNIHRVFTRRPKRQAKLKADLEAYFQQQVQRTDLQPSDVPSQDKGHSEAQS